jgi:hypothetical protein
MPARSDPQANFERMMARIEEMEQARSATARPRRRINFFLLCLPLTLMHSVLAVFLLRAAGWIGGSSLQRFLLLAATVLGLYLLNVALFAVVAVLAGSRRL